MATPLDDVMELFDCIVCGVAGTPESNEALRQAARLVAVGGRLLAVTSFDRIQEVDTTTSAVKVTGSSTGAKGEPHCEIPDVPATETVVIEGPVLPTLLQFAKKERATLIAIGTHGGRHMPGILSGSVTSHVLQNAHCSVLVARAPNEPERFPRTIVAGIDGSAESARAFEAASGLAARFDADVRAVAASRGKSFDLDAARAITDRVEVDERRPVAALVARSTGADLLVVGSRGLRGLRARALGSVSERVAGQALCSTLVVR